MSNGDDAGVPEERLYEDTILEAAKLAAFYSQARESGNPYPGDLSFQAVTQSGGSYKLYVIAHV